MITWAGARSGMPGFASGLIPALQRWPSAITGRQCAKRDVTQRLKQSRPNPGFNLVRSHAIAAHADADPDAGQSIQAALAVAAAMHQLGRLAKSERAQTAPGA
jgi:hypothetical protein